MTMFSRKEFEEIKSYSSYEEYLIKLAVELSSKTNDSYLVIKIIAMENIFNQLRVFLNTNNIQDVFQHIVDVTGSEIDSTWWLTPGFLITWD